jgi:hypothetical protein
MSKKLTFRRRIALTALLVGLIVIASGFSCQKAKTAAVAVDRYADSLSTFQDVAKQQHDKGRINDQNYANLLKSEKEASHAGRDLDQAILLANNGASFSQQVDAAQLAFNDMAGLIGGVKNPEAVAALQAAVAISAGLLKDAILLIQQVKPPAPGAPVKAPAAMWLMGLGLIGMAAGAGDGVSAGILVALGILKEIAELEPIGLQAVLNFTRSLKGMTTEEVIALTESKFDKIDKTADDELAKLNLPPDPPSS